MSVHVREIKMVESTRQLLGYSSAAALAADGEHYIYYQRFAPIGQQLVRNWREQGIVVSKDNPTAKRPTMPSLFYISKPNLAGALDSKVRLSVVWFNDKDAEVYDHELLQYELMLGVHRASQNYFALVPRQPKAGEQEKPDAIGALDSVAPDMLDDDNFVRANDLCKRLFGRTLSREEV